MTGLDQIAPPDGPRSCVPSAFFRNGFGSSGTTQAFQISSPVLASSATTLPRAVQNG